MITLADWHEFLYACELGGQQWLHVDRVGHTYIAWRMGWKTAEFPNSAWGEKVQAMMDAFSVEPQAGEETLLRLLEEPQHGNGGVLSEIPEEIKHRIVKMLHYVVREKPNPNEWSN